MNAKLRIAFALSMGLLAIVGTLLAMEPPQSDTPQPANTSDAVQAASEPYLVKDIYSGTESSNPSNLTQVDDMLFFTADDSSHGVELWKSDGTPTSTVMVQDIYLVPGSSSSPNYLTEVNGVLFFSANDGSHGRELWKSDGTPTGTILITDINPTGSSDPRYLTNLNGTLLFGANSGNNYELWKSDGTPTGTIAIKDTDPTSQFAGPVYLTRAGDTLFFMAGDGVHGGELWKSDGTPTCTVMITDIYPGSPGSAPSNLINVQGTLFFLADDGVHGRELWKSDGTPTGTVMVSDTVAGSGSFTPTELTDVNGTLFYVVNKQELWKSNGTPAGTMMIKAFPPFSMGNSVYSPTNANGTVFFVAYDDTLGHELWKSDGTLAGTMMVKDIITGTCGGPCGSMPGDLINAYGTLFFHARLSPYGRELWKSDGTLTGTVMVKDINPTGDIWTSNFHRATAGGMLFFTPDDGSHGVELWALQVVTTNAQLTVTKQASPDPVQAGSQLTYTLRVTNTGNVDLHAAITDTLPDHVTPTGLLTWIATLTAPGGVWTQSVVVTVARGYSGTLMNRVQVTSQEGATGEAQVTVNAIGYQIYLPIVLKK